MSSDHQSPPLNETQSRQYSRTGVGSQNIKLERGRASRSPSPLPKSPRLATNTGPQGPPQETSAGGLSNKSLLKLASAPTKNDKTNRAITPFGGDCPLNEYEKLRIKFQKQGISSLQMKALRRMSTYFNQESEELTKLPILKQLIQITNQLMMNEFEIVQWNIINREIDLLDVPSDHFIELLMMTALQAKRMTCEVNLIRVFEAFLGHNYPQFMINYETWKSQLQHFADEEKTDFEKINDSFRILYSDCLNNQQANFEMDLNFIVDSLEDEHVRRAVHTTKTMAEIEEENGGIDEEQFHNTKANQIAAMFARKRGRKNTGNFTNPRESRKNERSRRISSDDDGQEPRRSRSRSFQIQTDDKEPRRGVSRSRKHSQSITPEPRSPRNVEPPKQSKDKSVGEGSDIPQKAAEPELQETQYEAAQSFAFGLRAPVGGSFSLPFHLPQGSGTGSIQILYPNYTNYNFHHSQIQMGQSPFFTNQPNPQQNEPFAGPFENAHLNLINSINNKKKESSATTPTQKGQNVGGLPSFIPHMQSGESFGNNLSFYRSFNGQELFAPRFRDQQSLSIDFANRRDQASQAQQQPEAGCNTNQQKAPFFPGGGQNPTGNNPSGTSSLGQQVIGFFSTIPMNTLTQNAVNQQYHANHHNPSFPPSIQGSIQKPQVAQSMPVAYGHQQPGMFHFFAGPPGAGGLPEFGSVIDRGSFPYIIAPPGAGIGSNMPKSGSFERSPHSKFMKVTQGANKQVIKQVVQQAPQSQLTKDDKKTD